MYTDQFSLSALYLLSLTIAITCPLLSFFLYSPGAPPHPHSFPTRRSSDLCLSKMGDDGSCVCANHDAARLFSRADTNGVPDRSEEHTSELQSRGHLVCRLLLEKKNKNRTHNEDTSQCRRTEDKHHTTPQAN